MRDVVIAKIYLPSNYSAFLKHAKTLLELCSSQSPAV
jgi:hypothetical protein